MADVFEHAFAQAPIGIAMVGLTGTLLYANDALCRMTGRAADAILARSFRDLCDPRDADIDAPQLTALRDGVVPGYQVEKRFRHADGHDLWVLLHVSIVRDREHKPLYFIVHVQEISDRKAFEDRLERLADYDHLTGLLNGRRFDQALAQEIKAAARYGDGAVLLLDLDHFKTVNDRLGHQAGDELLRTAALSLRQRTRETDVLARLGGDEFAIILRQVDTHQAEHVAEGLVHALRQRPGMLADEQISVTASVGVAMIDGLTAAEILAAADMAMYAAKEAGGDQFVLYRPTGAAAAHPSRLSDAESIRRAIAQGRFELYGQPLLDLAHEEINRYELLARLRTAEGELLPPSAFLGVAARFGMSAAVDAWVVRQAAALVALQRARGRAIALHVNVAVHSMSRQMVAAIDEAIAEFDIDPRSLVFEVTEAAVAGHVEQARAFVDDVRRRGCRIALDNFGTALGGFQCLKQFEVDFLKIHGEIAGGAAAVDMLVVDAIVGIARGLGTHTVAELVADQDALRRLRRSGVDFAQGFQVGAPKPVAEVLG